MPHTVAAPAPRLRRRSPRRRFFGTVAWLYAGAVAVVLALFEGDPMMHPASTVDDRWHGVSHAAAWLLLLGLFVAVSLLLSSRRVQAGLAGQTTSSGDQAAAGRA